MARNLTLMLNDRPGALADVGEALGKAGINIEGFCGFVVNRHGFIHIVVEDGDAAKKVLEGITDVAADREVILVEVEDRPGVLGEMSRKIATAGINLSFAYVASRSRICVGSDEDIEGLRRLLVQ